MNCLGSFLIYEFICLLVLNNGNRDFFKWCDIKLLAEEAEFGMMVVLINCWCEENLFCAFKSFSDLVVLTVTMWLLVQLMVPSMFGMYSLGSWRELLPSITGEGKLPVPSEAGSDLWIWMRKTCGHRALLFGLVCENFYMQVLCGWVALFSRLGKDYWRLILVKYISCILKKQYPSWAY